MGDELDPGGVGGCCGTERRGSRFKRMEREPASATATLSTIRGEQVIVAVYRPELAVVRPLSMIFDDIAKRVAIVLSLLGPVPARRPPRANATAASAQSGR